MASKQATPAGKLMPQFMTWTKSLQNSTPPQLRPGDAVTLASPHVVCVVGASRGIGEQIARAFAMAGATGVALCARSTDSLQGVATAIRQAKPDCKVEVVACDVASAASVEAAAKAVDKAFGRLDTLVMNSGWHGLHQTDLLSEDPEAVATAFSVNAVGTFNVARSFVPLLQKTDGGAKSFFVTCSSSATDIASGAANFKYCVSKLAQARIVEFVHELYGAQGVLAVNFHPGSVATDMFFDAVPDKEMAKVLAAQYCTDDVALCGAYMVAVSARRHEMSWLGGRLIAATWDLDELVSRKDEIVEQDLLRSVIRL